MTRVVYEKALRAGWMKLEKPQRKIDCCLYQHTIKNVGHNPFCFSHFSQCKTNKKDDLGLQLSPPYLYTILLSSGHFASL